MQEQHDGHSSRKINWQVIREDLLSILPFMKGYLRNPVQAVRQIPDWKWPSLLIFQGAAGAVSGAASGLVATSFAQTLAGFFLIPFSSLICALVVSGFFYYCFMLLLRREINFKQCFTLVVLAGLPVLVTHIFSFMLPPVQLIGVAVACALLIVGFVEHFQLPKKSVIRVVAALGAVFLISWVINLIQSSKREEQFYQKTTPESLEILEKEMKGE